jgi:hypothetical protein
MVPSLPWEAASVRLMEVDGAMFVAIGLPVMARPNPQPALSR